MSVSSMLASTKTIGGKTCGELFQFALSSFRKEFAQKNVDPSTLRVNAKIGRILPSLVTTSVIEGQDGTSNLTEAYARYLSGKEPQMKMNFEHVKFGYWLPPAYARRIESEVLKNHDGKSHKFVEIGKEKTWIEALERSPAEPGLSRFVPLSNEHISLGGWSDLQPVQVLKAAGCQKVVYLTRRSAESTFLVGNTPIDGQRPAQGIAELLGLQEEGRKSIFDLTTPSSGFSVALQQADAVWCTDWNRFKDLETTEMMDESYNSEIVSKDLFFASSTKRTNRIATSHIIGCSPNNDDSR
jgi:hypothetical protein